MHLVLGGALLMPFWLLSTVLVGGQLTEPDWREVVVQQLATLAVALPMAWVAALLPMVRVLLSTAARALAATGPGELASGPATSWAARRSTATWFCLHLLLGGVVSGISLTTPPLAALLCLAPHSASRHSGLGWLRDFPGLNLLLGAALMLLTLSISAGAGALLAHCAPALLGPTPAERLAAAEERTAVLAQRNRLARELHDSVGHALSAVSIQAAAAGRVLRSNPDFAAEALAAIEELAREAVGELDTVLGVLREEEGDPAVTGGPTLAGLDLLVRQLALAGVPVETHTGAGLALLPEPVSREAYRIVQEGLTNVLRHAGPVPATLRLDLRDGRLDVELTNPIGAGRPSRPGGGRGLRGVAERVAALHGGCESGRTGDGDRWRLAVWLPVTTV
ncbi:sensor histidine kinase [Kitasatospora kifunensis]|uniref:histidine kinase n=1 Tax=Kitasatospora kifunensis TaxID=58351 RepID=A0A7W7QZF9_KITKI|nr:histidine kinase [Kitasatospora kifunensis]MBB4922645.1 signal transduction histidine kinase [Kitasatospora kifunensis]